MSDYEVAKTLGEVINCINRLRLKVNVDHKVWNLVDSIDCERQKYFDRYVSGNYIMGFTVMASYYSEKSMKVLVGLASEMLVGLSLVMM